MPNVFLTKVLGGLAVTAIIVSVILFYKGKADSIEKNVVKEKVEALSSNIQKNEIATKKVSETRSSGELLRRSTDVQIEKLVAKEKDGVKNEFKLSSQVPSDVIDVFNAGLQPIPTESKN